MKHRILTILTFAWLHATTGHAAEAVKLIAHRGGIVDERFAENSAASLEAAIRDLYDVKT